MIVDLPFNLWIEGDFPFRQKRVLRVCDSHPFLLADHTHEHFEFSRATTVDGTTYSFFWGPDGYTYRLLLNRDGAPATIGDLEGAEHESLLGHFLKRGWWKDHPSAIDLASELDLRITYAAPDGQPVSSLSSALGKRLVERPISRARTIARIQSLADLLRVTRHGILMQSPLPGHVVKKDGDRITVEPWIPVASEGDAPICIHFYGDCFDQAQECAALLNERSGFAVVANRPTPGATELDDDSLEGERLMRLILNDPVDDSFFWHPVRATLMAMLRMEAQLERKGKEARRDLQPFDGGSDTAFWLPSYLQSRRLRQLSPKLGIPLRAVELAIEFSSAFYSKSP